MTIAQTKYELNGYAYLLEQMKRKQKEWQQWAEIDRVNTSIFSSTPVFSQESSEVKQAILAQTQLVQELAQEICELDKKKKWIELSVQKLTDRNQKLIVQKHYLDQMTFEQIAEEMNFSVRHVLRLNNRALAQISHCMSQEL